MQEAGSDPPANNPASQGRSNGRQGQADPAAAVEQRGGTDQALPDVPTSDALYLQQQVLQAARLYLLQQQHTEGAKGLAGSGPDKQQQLLQAPLAMAMVSPSSFTAQQLQLLQQSGLLASQPLQGLLQQQHQALALQQLQEFYKKQQEQLQMQLLQQQQQQQQLAASKSHKDVAGQHLAFQQQLLQQQQLLALQRQGLLGLASTQPSLSIQAIQQGLLSADLWKEVLQGGMAAGSGGSAGRGEDGGTTKNGAVDVSVSTPTSASASTTQSPVHSLMLNGKMSSHRESARDESSRHSLYRHGTCKWPGCEAICDSYSDFLKHLNSDHALDDRSTAQCRVQMQVVQQLEIQLGKEQQRLQAMTAHLQAKQGEPKPSVHPLNMTAAGILGKLTMESTSLSVPRSPSNISGGLGAAGLSGLTVLTPASMQAMQAVGPARRRSTERYSSLSSDIAQNQEFYKNAEVRPPFTYASLIRQAIIESPDHQMTLNEIYNWFTRTFAYFRTNTATWKNAVRHNLSLHKCFVRVENVKGAVWTVDEIEFQKRRSQKLPGSSSPPASLFSRGSPTLMKGLDYTGSLNSTLQTVLSDGTLPYLGLSGTMPPSMLSAGGRAVLEQNTLWEQAGRGICSNVSSPERHAMFMKEEPLTEGDEAAREEEPEEEEVQHFEDVEQLEEVLQQEDEEEDAVQDEMLEEDDAVHVREEEQEEVEDESGLDLDEEPIPLVTSSIKSPGALESVLVFPDNEMDTESPTSAPFEPGLFQMLPPHVATP